MSGTFTRPSFEDLLKGSPQRAATSPCIGQVSQTQTGMTWMLLVHAAATWLMVGVILAVQLIIYPQFSLVPPEAFSEYHRGHMRRISWIVVPAMVIELITAFLILLSHPESLLAWVGAVLVLCVWAVTGLVQVPQHGRLSNDHDPETVSRLVSGNWSRTLIWSVRGVVAAAMLI